MTHYGFLSTYPPTRCGLATFAQALADGLLPGSTDSASVVRVLDATDAPFAVKSHGRARVRAELIAGDRASRERSVAVLNACDVAIVQHEYGIYGGLDGDEVLDVLAALTVPTIVVLHTVLAAPTPGQLVVLTEVCRRASVIVVMTAAARDILARTYTVDLSRVRVIAHGVPATSAHERPVHSVKRILTWGLISPGKGIEWAIRAMSRLTDLQPQVQYTVAGQTHPKVLAHAGESYRTMLTELISELDLNEAVHLDGRYLEAAELERLLAEADVVLLPYDSRVQVTSGVLAEAVAAGVPVVATRFPHATELLADGAGIITHHEDADSMAQALRTILTTDSVADTMRQAAVRSAAHTSWPAIAARYRSIAVALVAAKAA